MRKLALFLLLLSPYILSSQNYVTDNFPTVNGKITYSGVITVDSANTMPMLYHRAKLWALDKLEFNSGIFKVESDDYSQLVIKSCIKKGHNAAVLNPKNWYLLKLDFKDGEISYTLFDIAYEFDVSSAGYSQHFYSSFESWINSSNGKKKSNKKELEVRTLLTKYCDELDGNFQSVIYSLKRNFNKAE
jgi:hypothetical protein